MTVTPKYYGSLEIIAFWQGAVISFYVILHLRRFSINVANAISNMTKANNASYVTIHNKVRNESSSAPLLSYEFERSKKD